MSNGAVGTAANGMLFAPNAGVPGWTPVENALVPPALAFWCAIDGTCHIDDPCVAACASVEAVHVGPSNAILNGTAGADVLCGDERDDVIRGKGGDDLICGFAGADTLNGNDGADEIHGDGGGDDTDKLFGELGGDVCENGETVLTCENF